MSPFQRCLAMSFFMMPQFIKYLTLDMFIHDFIKCLNSQNSARRLLYLVSRAMFFCSAVTWSVWIYRTDHLVCFLSRMAIWSYEIWLCAVVIRRYEFVFHNNCRIFFQNSFIKHFYSWYDKLNIVWNTNRRRIMVLNISKYMRLMNLWPELILCMLIVIH